MTITVNNVHAWEPVSRWRPPDSWRAIPRDYKALLAIGRTTDHRSSAPVHEVALIEKVLLDQKDTSLTYRRSAGSGVPLSVTQRLDMAATEILRKSMFGITAHHEKLDILTQNKAKDRASRELLVPDPAIFSGYDRHVDRNMKHMGEEWWGLGVPA